MDEEYIKTLSDVEKTAFLKIFCKLIKADGAIEAEEVEFLKAIAARYGFSSNTMVEIIKMAPTIDCMTEARQIKNRQHALELIKEMCLLANIDDDLHDAELDIIIDVARVMGIEDEKVIVINRWVLDNLILMKTGRLILEKDNG
ncbi:MAG: TerB family tellurite resistance protein [Alphaproteobacteria bacterium]|nr:TerB family tellurite resistance protein [Alphaproteobacteria bacterium]